MLNSLVDLAKESCSDKRRELLGQVSALFIADADRYTSEEMTLFTGVLKKLINDAKTQDKAKLSARLAHVDETPNDLALELASDDAAIAKYMLQYSNSLTRDDLILLARSKGQDHLLAISKRDHLESRLTDILLERGEQPVRRSIADNPGAELSEWGMRLLMKLAGSDAPLRESMTHRADLSAEHFEKLISLLPEGQGESVRNMNAQNSQLVEKILHDAGKAVAGGSLERRRSRLDAKVALKDIRSGKTSLNEVFLAYSLSRNLFDLAFILAEVSGLDQKYVTNVMIRYEIDGVAVLCRALSIGTSEFNMFCKARGAHLKLSKNAIDNWMRDYQLLSEEEAQRVLRFIKVRLKMAEAA
ncbi:DUF2336 domain-containing protein [Roseibium polysiphoniae]|uniref:DUF2336 domain-containing protein n=1 Tax=Roseibium polysiphoniae TaxID=2571221 RepID=UPI003299D8ED